ncbi:MULTISPECIES: TetR/AcrR family transcriptional regulator [Thermocrispum]|jgi:AcrR family transcriptional regulator|uniref:TetR/AcrR family transcriptional regulator n=1 Tax=Thermocrispum agreste TaxID=37925 RepID=A0A2W4JJS4_9PSEU|nr:MULTISPECIES: TetR/AcrR family transcriptional regulator [Thermocrispum]PZM93977.1 MAG: TetR/AcrR family transcriptional regulator [Thermocrispum agreste]
MAYRRTPAVQARLDAQRAAIVQAAHDVLAEHGYTGCTMAAVAARAGVATGTIYRHFPSKSALAVELFRAVVDREVSAVAEASASGDALERVVAVTETFARRALKAPRLAYALLAEPVDPAVDAERLVYRRAFRDIIAKHVAEGVAAGVLPPQDAELTAAALVGAVAEALIGPLSTGDHPDIVPAMTAFTLRALGVQHAPNP